MWLRFVILTHDWPVLHWDLLLEEGETLRAWRLLQEPIDESLPIDAEPLPPHRLFYLDYEGPVSGDRGTVTRWDRGTYRLLAETEHELQIEFAGGRLQGEWRLSKTLTSPERWQLVRREATGNLRKNR